MGTVPKHLTIKSSVSSPPPPPPPSPIFRQAFNVQTGKLEWEARPVDYDYHQEIARSGYADMLHDIDRNILYQEAIRQAIKKLVSDNKDKDRHFHCLDIGTGSGLLSMMVVQAFKEENYNNFKVTACECFQPMGECARKAVARNNMDDKINVILKRSTELDFAEDLNSTKVDLLVAELLDTELIGEGCLHVYRHALENFCKPDCIVIPQKARIYVQPVQSSTLYDRHQITSPIVYSKTEKARQRLEKSGDGHDQITIPKDIAICASSHSLYDVQLSELLQDYEFSRLCEPQVAFEFDFSNIDTLKLFDSKGLEFTIDQNIVEPMMVFMWWDLTMITDKNSLSGDEIFLSCAPTWALQEEPLNKDIFTEAPVWRDHWMQAIYYFSSTITLRSIINQLKIGDKLTIYCNHDDYSLWFDLRPHLSPIKQPISCSCGMHARLNRQRISMLNDSDRLSLLAEAIEEFIQKSEKDLRVLYLGHISFLPVILAKYPQVSRIYFYDNSSDSNFAHGLYKNLLKENQCQVDIIKVNELAREEFLSLMDSDSEQNKSQALTGANTDAIDFIVSEPYFQVVSLPWDLLHYSTILHNLQSAGVPTTGKLLVTNATIKCILVDFEYLGRIRSPVKVFQGFDLQDFDNLINSSRDYADQSVEPQPLWEYANIALLPEATSLFEFDFNLPTQSGLGEDNDGIMTIVKKFTCDIDIINLSNQKDTQGLAIALWMDYDLYEDVKANSSDTSNRIIRTGPVNEIREGQRIEWHKDWKQGVCFLSGLNPISDDRSQNSINLRIDYNIKSGEMSVTQLVGSVVF